MTAPEFEPPKYAQIVAAIRHRIANGTYPPGSLLPSETKLIEEFGVSRPTVVRALEQLKLAGEIDREHGRGSFVKDAAAAPDVRARLADLMDQRHRDLRLTWDQVASRAGIHRETLRQIRSGSSDTIRPLSTTGLETALEWERGSIDAILDGGQVIPLGSEATPTDLAQALAETTANLDAYIERRAQEIAASRIAAVEQDACERIAEIERQAAADKQRASDLEAELRRQIDIQVRRAEQVEERLAFIEEETAQ